MPFPLRIRCTQIPYTIQITAVAPTIINRTITNERAVFTTTKCHNCDRGLVIILRGPSPFYGCPITKRPSRISKIQFADHAKYLQTEKFISRCEHRTLFFLERYAAPHIPSNHVVRVRRSKPRSSNASFDNRGHAGSDKSRSSARTAESGFAHVAARIRRFPAWIS